VIQTENDHAKDVFNGDIGQVVSIHQIERRSKSGLTSGNPRSSPRQCSREP
jgi:ATP-dependent exoDNAse (exonuclease V) alpha subunit